MKRFKNRALLILAVVGVLLLGSSLQASVTISFKRSLNGGNGYFLCDAANDLDFLDIATGKCAVTMNTYDAWLTHIMTAGNDILFDTAGTSPDTINEGVGRNDDIVIYESQTGKCHTTDGVQSNESLVLYLKDHTCGPDYSYINKEIRVGPPLLMSRAEINMNTKLCNGGYFGNALLSTTFAGTTYPKAAYNEVTPAGSQPQAQCSGNDLFMASVDVKEPTKIVVDLLKRKCYIPWECTTFKLVFEASWTGATTADRLADAAQDMYSCKLETTSGFTKSYAAKDYVLIGHPKFYDVTGLTLTSIEADANTCVITEKAHIKYLDQATGLCFGIIEGTGEYEAYHVTAFAEGTYTTVITTDTATVSYMDPNIGAGGYCEVANTAGTVTYLFDVGLRRWVYTCTAGGTFVYPEAGASPGYKAIGYDADKTWTCDGDSLDIVDLTAGTPYCQKGEFYLNYDATNLFCGGISLAIHQYDVKNWTDRDAATPKPLVDILNNRCKIQSNWYELTTHDGTNAGTFTCDSQATAYAVADVELFGEEYLAAAAISVSLDFTDKLCGVGADVGFFNSEFGICSIPTHTPKIFTLAKQTIALSGLTYENFGTAGTENPAVDSFVYPDTIVLADATVTPAKAFKRWRGDYQVEYTLDNAGTLTFHTQGSANQIGGKRFGSYEFRDDKIRVDLFNSKCYRINQKLNLVISDLGVPTCVFENNTQYYFNLEINNYELINMDQTFNDITNPNIEWILDFYQNKCWRKGYLKPYWMSKVASSEIVQIKSDSHTEDVVWCSQWKRDGSSIETVSTKGMKFARLGFPTFLDGSNQSPQINYFIDLSTLKCKKQVNGVGTDLNESGVQGISITDEADFDFETQSCTDWYLPTAYNSFTLQNQSNYIDAQELNAIIDVKNDVCYIRGQGASCSLDTTEADNDMVHVCTCNPNILYTFHRNAQQDIIFKYIGYPYMKLDYSVAPATRQLRNNQFTKTYGLSIEIHLKTPTDKCSVYLNGVKLGTAQLTFTPAEGKCALSEHADYDYDIYIYNQQYFYDFSELKVTANAAGYHDTQANVAANYKWIIDWAQMACFKLGSNDRYALIFVDNTPTYKCKVGTIEVTSATIGLEAHVIGAPIVAGNTLATLTMDYSKGSCLSGTDVWELDAQYGRCINKAAAPYLFYNELMATALTLTGLDTIIGTNSDAVAVVQLANNLKCYYQGTLCTGDTLMDDTTVRCNACAGTNYAFSIEEDWKYGTRLQFIGHTNINLESQDTYDLDIANDICYYYGYLFKFDSKTLSCHDNPDPLLRVWPDVSLRNRFLTYKIIDYGSALYIADYNLFKCHTWTDNSLDVYFKDDDLATTSTDETENWCRRLASNGDWENMDITLDTAAVADSYHGKTIGKDHDTYGNANSAIKFRINLETQSCFQGSTTGSEESLGNFVKELGICEKENDLGSGVKVMRTTHYVRYNSPELTNVSAYVDQQIDANFEYEMSYMYKEGADTCWTKQDRVPTACTAKVYFDNSAVYPDVAYSCQCSNHDAVITHLSDKGVKLDLMGTLHSRFQQADYYNSIDIDLVTFQCKSVNALMNYNTKTKKCYYADKAWFIYRQFYDIYNWTGKSAGNWLIDHFRAVCFDNTDCTPMKYSHKKDYGGGATDNFVYCRRLIDANEGFIERKQFNLVYEFGTELPDISTKSIIVASADNINTNTALTCSNSLGNYDFELNSCINPTDYLQDYSLNQLRIGATTTEETFFTDNNYLTTDKNLTPSSDYAVVFTAQNKCIVRPCVDDGTGLCTASTVYTGFVRMRQKSDGTLGWWCIEQDSAAITSSAYHELPMDKTIFIGGIMPPNHCASNKAIFGEIQDKSNYWLHVDIPNNKCWTFSPAIATGTWDITTQYIPSTVDLFKYAGTTDDTTGFSAFPDETPHTGIVTSTRYTCGNLQIWDYPHSLQYDTYNIYDWSPQRKCTLYDSALANTHSITDILYDSTTSKYYCGFDTGMTPNFDFNSNRSGTRRRLAITTNEYSLVTTDPLEESISIDLNDMTCTKVDSATSWRFFDANSALCDNHLYVGDLQKQITFKTGVDAFIDLSRKECIYDTNLRGHLVEFTFDTTRYYASTKTPATEYSLQDNSLQLGAYVTSIKCRHYDKATKALSIKSYDVGTVVLSGLEDYLKGQTVTSKLELYVIRIKAPVDGSSDIYECQKVEINGDFQDSFAPLDESTFTYAPTWSVYHRDTHKCENVSLIDKYTKWKIQPNFAFDFLVDQWEDRCIKEDGKVFQLLYDANGQANACKDHSVEYYDDEGAYFYINSSFKAYDVSKPVKSSAILFPIISKTYTSNTLTLTAATRTCQAGYTWNLERGYCIGTTNSDYVNLCDEDYVITEAITFAQQEYTNEGLVDLCKKKCYLNDGTTDMVTDGGWNLVFINEFEIQCQHPTDCTVPIQTRYNQQYTLFGNRGGYFNKKPTNDFQIRRVRVDLNAATCEIKDQDHLGWVTGGVFKYKDCDGDIIQNWYCEITYDSAVHQHFYLTEINHFRFENLGTFLEPEENNKVIRHRLLVDTFSGRCFYPSIPAGNAAQQNLDGKQLELNAFEKNVMKDIDSYTQQQVNPGNEGVAIKLTCNGQIFNIEHVWFAGWTNQIKVDDCPTGTYTNQDTKACDLCMYECNTCTGGYQCDACIPSYYECNHRCFQSTALAQAWITTGEKHTYWDGSQCKACRDNCATCSDFVTCSICEPGYILYSRTEVDDGTSKTVDDCILYEECEAMEGWFSDMSANPPRCSACQGSCVDCKGNNSSCSKCDAGSFLSIAADGAGTCNSGSCPNEAFDLGSSSELCSLCDSACGRCDGPTFMDCIAQGSTKCAAGYYPTLETAADGTHFTCTQLCNEGRYFLDDADANTPYCTECDQTKCHGCVQNQPTQCTSCRGELAYSALSNGFCTVDCGPKRFNYQDYINKVGETNFTAWRPEQPGAWQAIADKSGQTYYDFEEQCFDITAEDLLPFCDNCHTSCSQCSGPSNLECDACDKASGYYRYDDPTTGQMTCLQTCPDGYFQETTSNRCTPCNTNCAQCTNGLTCDVCRSGFYNLDGNCQDSCPVEGRFANKLTLTCDFCDTDSCTSCFEFNNKCNGCSQMPDDKNKLNTIDWTCVEVCPSGTYLDGNECKSCGAPMCNTNGTPVTGSTCTAPCSTCMGATECLTCQSGYMLMEDTKTCSQITECPDGYRSKPFSQGICQKCPENCKECNEWGCTECKDDFQWVLTGWPYKYCDADSDLGISVGANKKCYAQWYEDYDGECQECSHNCVDCDSGRYNCDACLTGGTLTQYNLGEEIVANLCMCPLGVTFSVDNSVYKTLTINIPDSVDLDWEEGIKQYDNSAMSTLKTEQDEILAIANTKKFNIDDVTNAAFGLRLGEGADDDQWKKCFIEMARAPNADLKVANERIQTAIVYKWPEWSAVNNEIKYDKNRGFGDRQYNKDLPRVLLEEQIWKSLGTFYSYTTSVSAGWRHISIKLGLDATYDADAYGLIFKKDVLKKDDCRYMAQRVFPYCTDYLSFNEPEVEVVHNYYPLAYDNVEICSPLVIEAQTLFFPTGQPLEYRWSVSNMIHRTSAFSDPELRQTINDFLSALPKQTRRFQFPSQIIKLIENQSIFLRVEAATKFTEFIATHTANILISGSGNQQLGIMNTDKEMYFDPRTDAKSFYIQVLAPPCKAGENHNSYLKGLEYTVVYYPTVDCTGTTAELVFDKTTMTFTVPKDTFTFGQNRCASITVGKAADTSLTPITYTFTLMPITTTPVLLTNVGSYFQTPARSFVDTQTKTIIPVEIEHQIDENLNLALGYECHMLDGTPCQILYYETNPTGVIASWGGTEGSNTQTFEILTSQLREGQTYIFTMTARYKDQQARRKVAIYTKPQMSPHNPATWFASGINPQGYAKAFNPVTLSIEPDNSVTQLPEDTYVWRYHVKDSAGQWSEVPVSGDNYSASGKTFQINSLWADCDHRVTVEAIQSGVKSKFMYEFTTVSTIDITWAVQNAGQASQRYSLDVINHNKSTHCLTYTWRYFTDTNKNGKVIVLNDQQEHLFGFIPDSGIVVVELEAKNAQTGEVRVVRTTVQNDAGTFLQDYLDDGLTPDEERNYLQGISKNNQLDATSLTTVQTSATSILNNLQLNTLEGQAEALSLILLQLQAVDSSAQGAVGAGKEFVQSLWDQIKKSDPSTESSLDFSGESISATAQVLTIGQFDDWYNLLITVWKYYEQLKTDTKITASEFKSFQDEFVNLKTFKVAQVSPNILEEFKRENDRESLRVFALSQPVIQKMQVEAAKESAAETNTQSTDAADAGRLLQEDTTTTDETTTDTADSEYTEVARDITCTHKFIIGTKTVENTSFHSAIFSSFTKQLASPLFEISTDLSETYDVPICEPVQIQIQKSTPNSNGQTKIEILNLSGLENDAQYTLCFTLDQEITGGVVFKIYNQSSNLWELDESGVEDTFNTNVDSNKFCRKVTKTGIVGAFYELDERPQRLYKGFILYLIIVIDIFLILGVVMGSKLDSQPTKVQQLKVQSAVATDKTGTQLVADDDAKKDEANAAPLPQTARSMNYPKVTFGAVFCISHRCGNIFYSKWHEIMRPSRAFSFALQALNLLAFMGLFVYVSLSSPYLTQTIQLTSVPERGVLAYFISFFIIRLANFAYRKVLLIAKKNKSATIAIYVVLAIIFILSHYASIHITLVMTDEEFNTWALAFVVAAFIETIVWEVCVAAWYFIAVKRHQQQQSKTRSAIAACLCHIPNELRKAFN